MTPSARTRQPQSAPAPSGPLALLRAAAAEPQTAGPTADHAAQPGRLQFRLVMMGYLLLALGAACAGLMLGSVHVPAQTVLRILAHAVLGERWVTPDWRAAHEIIVLQTRLPRVILAASVGASLGVAGMVIQALVRNPLAGPSILGVSSGAAVGAVLTMRFGLLGFGAFTLHVSAFLGGLATLALVFWIARTGGQIAPTRLILAGVAFSAVMSAFSSLLVLTSPDPQLAARVLFWTLGSFASAQWALLPIPLAGLGIGLIVLLLQARRLNLLLAGDESAQSLGLDVERFRRAMFVLTAALTGITVAVAGVIGFLGLILPHIVRLMLGADHRRGLPAVALLGAGFAIGADLIARWIIAPLELPVGIVTAMVGGPFFIWLLRRSAGQIR